MGGKGSGGLAVLTDEQGCPIDWPRHYAIYLADFEPMGATITDYAKHLRSQPRYVNLNITTVNSAFYRLKKKSALSTAHDRMKPLILKAQSAVSKALDNPDVDPNFALRAMEKAFEREEPNAGLAQQVNIVVPPLFASPVAQAAMKELTGGVGLDQKAEPSEQAKAIIELTRPR